MWRFYVLAHRLQNRWHDVRAILAGYCNDCPWRADPADGGGYRNWRCALKRGHKGMHRSRNYVWDEAGRTDYAPMRDFPQQPWGRNMTPTMRQARQMGDWQQRQLEKRRAACRERQARA